ncbi:lysR family transcriptional regulator [Bordetella pertussis]|nr:lysR family transcriptional regulator [Bordetella pertussis]
MSRNIDTALLRAFLAVHDTGSLTAAAALLHLTQRTCRACCAPIRCAIPMWTFR